MFDHLIVIYCAAYIVARCGGSDGEKNSPAEKRSGIRPRLPEDSEISNPNWQVPDNWTKQEDGAEFSGLLFAGKAEFSWIVDIRLEDQDLENWSIGNLITYAHVMTSCRAVAHLDDKFKKEDDESTIKLRETEMRIYFCSEYLWEKNGQDYEENYIDFSGARSIRGVILHPKCTLESFLYDFGVIELSKGIHPFVPNIGYMPINRKLSTGLIVNPHLQWMETKRWVCYVASYGKSYRNLKDNIAQDYKVKYRVYHANWRECEKYLYYICPIYIKGCNFTAEKERNLKKLMCFKHRKKVGAICDHDRGAPLVCEGYVYGIVVRGANQRHCHSMTPFPVIILKTFKFVNEFSNLFRFQRIKIDIEAYEGQNGCRCLHTCDNYVSYYLVLVMFIISSKRIVSS